MRIVSHVLRQEDEFLDATSGEQLPDLSFLEEIEGVLSIIHFPNTLLSIIHFPNTLSSSEGVSLPC